MQAKLFFALLLLTAALSANAQTPDSNALATEPKDSIVKTTQANQTTLPDASNKNNQSSNSTQDYIRPDRKTRFNRYVKSTVGPVAIARNVVGAGYSTWTNSPEEWGTHWDGFGKRFASNMGKRAIGNTTVYALDEALKVDSYYYLSQDRRIGARVRNAVLSTVTARNREGKRVFGLPRIAGTYASNIIANETWYPSRYSYKDGLRSGTISLGMNVLYNLAREIIRK
jgi:hypothetical protein